MFLLCMTTVLQACDNNYARLSKSLSKRIKENQQKVSFADVAGMKEAKEEVQEIVEFLKKPEKFTKLGARIPKGVLLIGPPGTGKTLLAKAIAYESGVPFFYHAGSDFVETFVGVGASRVRSLFEKAKRNAPCIIFIDEIDTIGKKRSIDSNMSGGKEEFDNTLNALLVEMDGFSKNSNIIIIAATNRGQLLDPALVRPGRFDKQISISNPDQIERKEIIECHIKDIPLGEPIDTTQLAAQTPGFSGADLSSICNDAALIAARQNKEKVTMDDFQAALDRRISGPEKKHNLISATDKNIVAHHEAGHAIASWFLEHADPMFKVTIVPHGTDALGLTQFLPKERFLYQKDQLDHKLQTLLGGRVAEELCLGKISTGAADDLQHATRIAYEMVTLYGISNKPSELYILFDHSQQSEYPFTKLRAEQTLQNIDTAVKEIIDKAYNNVKNLLSTHKQKVEILAKALLEKETILKTDLEQLIGKGADKKS